MAGFTQEEQVIQAIISYIKKTKEFDLFINGQSSNIYNTELSTHIFNLVVNNNLFKILGMSEDKSVNYIMTEMSHSYKQKHKYQSQDIKISVYSDTDKFQEFRLFNTTFQHSTITLVHIFGCPLFMKGGYYSLKELKHSIDIAREHAINMKTDMDDVITFLNNITVHMHVLSKDKMYITFEMVI